MKNGKDKSQKEKPPSRRRYENLLIIFITSFLVTIVVGVMNPFWAEVYRAGDVAKSNIRATSDIYVQSLDTTVKKGEIIVREGERVSEDQLKKLSAQRGSGMSILLPMQRLGTLLILLFLSFASIYEFAERNVKKFKLRRKDIIFGSTILLFMVFVFKFCMVVFQHYAPDLVMKLIYLVPLFSFGIIIRIVLFSEAAIVFSIMLAITMGFAVESNFQMVLYAFTGNILAAYFSGRCENRNTILKAGLYTSVIMGFFIMAHNVFIGYPLREIPAQFPFIIVSGIGSSFVALGLLPVIEHVFDYTTDIKLLELANFEHPLLEEMMVKAAGTYHHSIVVGNLSKAAAEKIGANPLLARVSSYYHDIGKLKMPHYFIENRTGFEDAHKSLSPNMSALIILSHVKEGVELAERYRLGRKITDIIKQHHGTTIVSYFYNRAKEMEDPNLHIIQEKDFRYPGPKPQTKEAGIVMLADAVEAASRLLEDPTPKRIETHVQDIIERIFLDGQLDECELTLKDLNAIQMSFTTILLGIFHQRIEYPLKTQPNGTDKKLPKTAQG